MSEPVEFLPAARREGIIRKEVDGELLVYDLERDKAHCLNPTAALVWNCCDGRQSVSEITRDVSQTLGAPVDETVVHLALQQLDGSHLLAERIQEYSVSKPNDFSRRALVRRLGMAAVLLPLVTTITAPTASAAGSQCSGPCVPGGGGCAIGCTCQATGPGTGVCVLI